MHERLFDLVELVETDERVIEVPYFEIAYGEIQSGRELLVIEGLAGIAISARQFVVDEETVPCYVSIITYRSPAPTLNPVSSAIW